MEKILNKEDHYDKNQYDKKEWKKLSTIRQEMVLFDGEYFGHNCTNNETEYKALVGSLQSCLYHKREFDIKKIIVHGDSQIVIKQMNKEIGIKKKKLIELSHQVAQLVDELQPVEVFFEWIPRELNVKADEIANNVLDRELDGGKDDDVDDDVDVDFDELDNNFGFTNEEINILFSYGMKPWNDFNECVKFIKAYKSDERDEDGNPTWGQFLQSSTMWDD